MENKLTTTTHLEQLAAGNFYTASTLLDYRMKVGEYPRIKTIPEEPAMEALRAIVWKAYMYRGNKADEETVDFTTSALYNEIVLDRDHCGLRELTIQEIDYVIRAAALNQGREMYGICVASLYASLCDYARTLGNELDKKAKAVKACTAIDTMTSVYGQQLLQNNK